MGPAVAQETPPPSQCPPVTLDDLFTPPDADLAPVDGETEPPAQEAPPPQPPDCTPFVYRMVFPVVGSAIAVSSFGAARSEHLHEGNDIAAPALAPVVAVADGRISWIDEECCSLAVRHNDGWWSYYIHLNNDTYGTDDGLGWGIAPGLEIDSVVKAGQIIGWVGDSGNAEDSAPHLHFELHTPADVPVDPAPSLAAARRSPAEFRGPFSDDDGSPFAEAIGTLASLGLLAGCGEGAAEFCPNEPITGLQVAALTKRITDLDLTNAVIARSPEGPWQDAQVARTGFRSPPWALDRCPLPEFCSPDPISFPDLHRLATALPLLAPPGLDTLMTVDDLAASIDDQLENPTPLAYCSINRAGFVTKGQFAEMIARALGMVGPPPCDQIE